MTRALLSTVAVLTFVAGMSAQAKPNFAGKWRAEGSFTTWTIAVDGNKMTVTMTVAGNSESTVYLLDGTPSPKTFEGPKGPAENVYTSRWEGDTLVTTINTAFNSTMVEKRWLEADGTMKVQTTLTHMQGKPAPPPPPGVGLPMVLKKVGVPIALAQGQDSPPLARALANPGGYEAGSNIGRASALRGRLKIMHGTSDVMAPLSTTMRMAQALIEANRIFDL